MHISIDFIDKNKDIDLQPLYACDVKRALQWRFISESIPALSLGHYQYNENKDIAVSLFSKAIIPLPNNKNGNYYRVAKRGLKKGVSKGNKEDYFLITACKVKDSIEEACFLKQFDAALTYVTYQEGFIRFWLLESISKEIPYRYINIAQWQNLDYFMSTFHSKKFQEKLDSDLSMQNKITVSKLKL